MTIEVIALGPGETGKIVLYAEHDVLDPLVIVEGSDDFVVEKVLLEHLPTPTVDVSYNRRGEWSARVRGILTGPEKPLHVLVRNTCGGKVFLRAKINEENE